MSRDRTWDSPVFCLSFSPLLHWHKKKVNHNSTSSSSHHSHSSKSCFIFTNLHQNPMLPLPNPPKLGGRKSPFLDPPDPKRRRVSDSPRPPLNTSYIAAIPRPDIKGGYYGSAEMAMDRQHPLQVMTPSPQDLGPGPDVS